MKVIFAKDRKVGSLLIKFFTWSRYHHCGVVTEDGKYIIEATTQKGVVQTPIDKFKARYKNKVVIADITCDDAKAFEFLYSQLGKDYDWKAIFNLVFRFTDDNDNKWFCSELVATASGLFRKERTERVTPELLWMISK